MTRHGVSWFVVAIVGMALGCNKYTGDVHGTVTAEGEPVDGGSLVFRPMADGVKPAAGDVAEDGTYVVVTAEGGKIRPGEYMVTYMPPAAVEDIDGNLGAPSKWSEWMAPEVTVVIQDGPNDVPIQLKKMPPPAKVEDPAKDEADPAKEEAKAEEAEQKEAKPEEAPTEKPEADAPKQEEEPAEAKEAPST